MQALRSIREHIKCLQEISTLYNASNQQPLPAEHDAFVYRGGGGGGYVIWDFGKHMGFEAGKLYIFGLYFYMPQTHIQLLMIIL